VERLRPEMKRAAAESLAEAFWHDPLTLILAPHERDRAARGAWMMGMAVEYGLRWGEVWANEDASAVAIWLPPESAHMSMVRMARVGLLAAPLHIGLRTLPTLARMSIATAELHKAVKGDHWYLATLGTRRAAQGQGLGSALLEMGTTKADAAGLPCYLETATQENVAFYRKRGFDVTGEKLVAGHRIYGMVRPARTG
jgi:ribosomal protein S18 acetylase RimI-like enzyme